MASAAGSGMDNYDPLFTMDVVRDFMAANGGKVNNTTLVTHFRSFLNDPQRKNANRQRFKHYVNTLATVKLDVSGDKVLVLKRKYRDSVDENSEPHSVVAAAPIKSAGTSSGTKQSGKSVVPQKDLAVANHPPSASESGGHSKTAEKGDLQSMKTMSFGSTELLTDTAEKGDLQSMKTLSFGSTELLTDTSLAEDDQPMESHDESATSTQAGNLDASQDKESLAVKLEDVQLDQVKISRYDKQSTEVLRACEKKDEHSPGSGWKSEIVDGDLGAAVFSVMSSSTSNANVHSSPMEDVVISSQEGSVVNKEQNKENFDESFVVEEQVQAIFQKSTSSPPKQSTDTVDHGPAKKPREGGAILGLFAGLHPSRITSPTSRSHSAERSAAQPTLLKDTAKDSSGASRTAEPSRSTPPPEQHTPNTANTSGIDNSDGLTVRERARHLNKIESGANIAIPLPSSGTGVNSGLRPTGVGVGGKRDRDSRKREEDGGGEEDYTLDEVKREWILKSAPSDYQAMAKLLQSHPDLAPRKDFISGYTALHWAAKNGQTDVVKLLCGTYNVNPNIRSQGGYTPLHFAAMHNHEETAEVLARTYGASTSLRDYSGRKPKNLLPTNASSRLHEILAPRRQGHTYADSSMGTGAGLTRSGSHSSRVAKTLGIDAGDSWRSHSPSTNSPGASPSFSRKDGSSYGKEDNNSGLMPPPRELPTVVRRKPTAGGSSRDGAGTATETSHSDSETHGGSGDAGMHGGGTGGGTGGSIPNFVTLV